jgi:hypothetical protein
MNPPPLASSSVSVSPRRCVACSICTAAGLLASSRISRALCSPSPRKESRTFMLLAVGPLTTATNQVLLLRRASAATSPISEGGSTIVSSQTAGMRLIIAAHGLARMFFGCAPQVGRGAVNTAALATWCARVVSPRREPKCTGV